MTKREAVIVSAYTGYMLSSFEDMRRYADSLFGREVFTHEMGSVAFTERLRLLSKPDFVALKVEG